MDLEVLKQKAEKEAFQHTVFMALADIYNKLHPELSIGDFLVQLQENKYKEYNRLINEVITMKRTID